MLLLIFIAGESFEIRKGDIEEIGEYVVIKIMSDEILFCRILMCTGCPN